MNDMDQLHEIPDELFGLMGKKKFHELDERQQEMTLQWFTEEEFDRAASFIQDTEAVFRADEALLVPDPALAATLSARMRDKHSKPLLMRMIPVWQAAAALMIIAGAVWWSVQYTTPQEKTLAIRDTVYLTQEVAVTQTVYDTIYITQAATKQTPAQQITRQKQQQDTGISYTAGNTGAYPLHILEVSSLTDPQNAAAVNSMSDDPLVQRFGFRRF